MIVRKKGHKKAMVSIALGGEFEEYYRKHCKQGWGNYADRYGYDIIIFTDALDTSARAGQRSPSWQKCLIFRQPELHGYERVVWVDIDVVINPKAPCIVSQVPEAKIGGTDAYAFFSHDLHDYLYSEYIEMSAKWGRKLIVNRTGAEYYQNFDIDTSLNDVIQCGVLVMTPRLHTEVLDAAYAYEAKCDKVANYHYNYEMRPLSYEIVRRDLHYFIDQRFNLILSNFLYLSAPYLFSEEAEMKTSYDLLTKLAVQTAFAHSYFLHFAGDVYGKTYVRHLDSNLNQPLDIATLLS